MWLTELTIASTCRYQQIVSLKIKTSIPHSFTLERSPNHSPVPNCELSQTTAWKNAAFRDIEGIHDCDNIIATCACALYILQQLSCHQFVHVPTKVGWV